MITADGVMYVSKHLGITWCFPVDGRLVEAPDLTEDGVAFRLLDAKWYRWLHERVLLARKQGQPLPEFDHIREWLVGRHGPERVKLAESMQLPRGYVAPAAYGMEP